MNKINKLAIEQIIVLDKRPNHTIGWFDEERWMLGLFKEKAGFYDWVFKSKPYDEDKLRSGFYGGIKYLIENKTVYFRPCVKIKLISGDSKVIAKFNAYKSAVDYAEKFIDENNLDCEFIKI